MAGADALSRTLSSSVVAVAFGRERLAVIEGWHRLQVAGEATLHRIDDIFARCEREKPSESVLSSPSCSGLVGAWLAMS